MTSATGAMHEGATYWRLDTFSDAIFAVAMMLLVFSFPVASVP